MTSSWRRALLAVVSAATFGLAGPVGAGETARPWSDPKLSPDQRAALVAAQMSLDEKLQLIRTVFPLILKPPAAGVSASAGYTPGVARLGVPALRESDASLGIADAGRENDEATALPSGMALAASWDPDAVKAAGAMIGKEARQKGFNVLLSGGVNLVRDPFDGRDFEYLGEDPLLAGSLAASAVQGVQSQGTISTVKHFALNAQETGRMVLNARIGEAALRESDLLAFQLAIEGGRPGAVMCGYNRVNGPYACENRELLTGVLKQDWRYPGWVMSDWGAVHSVGAAEAGLDQESGAQIDKEVYFDGPLRAAIARGEASPARLDDMVRRILRSEFAVGLIDPAPTGGALDLTADAAVAERASERGLVLLKNAAGLLPLAADARRIAVIGGRADIGVLSGGGSSQVVPRGSVRTPHPPEASRFAPRAVYHPSPPLRAIRARAAKAEVRFDSGADPAAAARLAASSDITIVFARQWTTEGFDAKVGLDTGEDALIEAVTAANPKTVVVLETGGPVLTPWLARAGAVLEAWYPGSGGGEAVARVLFGEADPAGRLPVTFPARLEQSPRPKPVGSAPEDEGLARQAPSFDVDYREGSSVGYRWFAQTAAKPLFPFGFGLSYSRFCYGPLTLSGGRTVTASFTVANCGGRAGVDTPQLYLEAAPKRRQQRLLGWSKLDLKPGETRTVRLTVDPRLLANWDQGEHGWRLDAGAYRIFVGPNAGEIRHIASIRLPGRRLRP